MAAAMTTTAAKSNGDSGKHLAEHLQIRRTQARPKKTLFGSVLEPMSNAELQQLEAADQQLHWQRQLQKPDPIQQRVPQELLQATRARHLPDIQRSAQELEEYKRRLAVRERRVNLLERDCKFVLDLPHPLDSLARPKEANFGDRPRWMTRKDLAHSDKVNPNFLGQGVRNFNRDKYARQRGPSHQYALVGDPLRAGMDFDEKPAEETQPSLNQLGRPDRLITTPRTLCRQRHMRALPPADRSVHGVQLPANLQHEFGTDVCDSLLQSECSVQETSRRIQEMDRVRLKPRAETAAAAAAAASFESGDFVEAPCDQLGNALRSNVFGRSLPTDHKVSSNHLDYTRSQFENRPFIPDKWRYQKDHVSKWAEANVLEMRMKKALDERMDRLLHKTKAGD